MFTQEGRPLQVMTPLGQDTLVLLEVHGRESLSTPFSYRLKMMAERPVSADQLLRKPVSVKLETGNGYRYLHGLVNRFGEAGWDDGFYFYEAELVPWLWFLTLSRNLRSFQNVNVLTIVQHIFRELNCNDLESRCRRSYPAREYCVQYRESNFDFVSRLLEEEGIFYFFEHSENKHVLVLADENSAMMSAPYPLTWRTHGSRYMREDFLERLREEKVVRPSAVTLTDYDYLQPSLNLLRSTKAGPDEIYDYPGRYTDPGEGDRLSRIRLEAEEAQQRVWNGHGFLTAVQAGQLLPIQTPDSTITLAIRDVTFHCSAGDYRSWDTGAYEYHAQFAAIPEQTPYRPPLRTPRPVVHGSQTAIVVGPAGEEIWVDRHGRVKVQFHWDREGKKDEESSCWVRFSTAWAGKGWGQISIPRMGQEVIVDFLDGDPDRPIITGRVYNAEQPPPYPLPDKQAVSGVRSRSTKSGTTEMFNEIRMDDTKDAEELYIHAQKDERIVVENDRNLEVGHDEIIVIKNDRRDEVKNCETLTIGKDRGVTISGKSDYTVGGNETVTIRSDRSTKVNGKDELKVGKTLTIEATQSITLKVGSNTIKIDQSGITMDAIKFAVKGQAKVELSSPMTSVEGQAMLKLKGAMSQVNADAVLTLKGTLTTIN